MAKEKSFNENLADGIIGFIQYRQAKKEAERLEERRLRGIKAVEDFAEEWLRKERGYTAIKFKQVLKIKHGWDITINADNKPLKLKISDYGEILGYKHLAKDK